MLGLIGSSMLLPQEALFGRYPTAFYFLSTPLNVAFDVARIPYPFTANHVVNVLSVPAWLFVLRPILIGRWPDWRVLPVALLIYFQGPSIVYAGSGLLEPWAFVFVLLAMEAAVALDADRQWIAVLLAARPPPFSRTRRFCCVPPIWLLALVEWRGWRPALRPARHRRGRRGGHAVRSCTTPPAAACTSSAAMKSPTLPGCGPHRARRNGSRMSLPARPWRFDQRCGRDGLCLAWLSRGPPTGSATIHLGHHRDGPRHFLRCRRRLDSVTPAMAVPRLSAAGGVRITVCDRRIGSPDQRRACSDCGHAGRSRHCSLAQPRAVAALDFQPDYERNSLEWTARPDSIPDSLASRAGFPNLPDGAGISSCASSPSGSI